MTPIIFIVGVLFSYFGQPPMDYSNSVSLNAKINDIRINHPKSNLEVLSFGSSMNLNNLNSNVIVNNFGTKYLNISSWGQNMQETFNLLQIFVPFYKPKFVLISGNYVDFLSSNKNINYNSIKNYIYYKQFNTNINPFNQKSVQFYRNSNYKKRSYQNLSYDEYGGINFFGKGFEIKKSRWNGDKIKKPKLTQYKYLDSIINYCKNKQIKLIYSQSPFRHGFISKINTKEQTIINHHIYKLDSILNKNNIYFINSFKIAWPDSLFVDYSHLNKKGSVLYTRFITNNLKSLTKR